MANRRVLGTSLLLALCLAPALLLAQDIVFKADGGRLRGKILSETSRGVKIKTLGGTLFVPRDEIASIERDGDVFKKFAHKKKKLRTHDHKGWYKLGVWAQGQELYPQAIDCFYQVIAVAPNHEEARWELGFRRGPGQLAWATEGEYYEAKGYQRWQDRWVPPDEYSKLEAGLIKVDGHWVTPREAKAPGRRKAARKKSARGKKKGKATAAKPQARRQRFPWMRGAPLGGQVGQPPLSNDQREALLAEGKQAGGWAVAFSSKHYDLYSNGPEERVKKLGRIMDLMCKEYKRIFKFDQDLTRPFPVHLYGSQREFMSRTGKGAGTGGFYDGRKIVGFHGRIGSLNTQSVLFHEGTHQFQGLVMGRNMWRAKIWLIEGLAVYFEACEVKGRRLNVVIPRSRLASVRRAIRAGTYVPLRRLIRMEQAQFGALHYAHAWSLIHFLVNGARGGKKRFLEYWEKTKQGGYDGVKLFEELFDRPMDEIEAGWKQYVLTLQ